MNTKAMQFLVLALVAASSTMALASTDVRVSTLLHQVRVFEGAQQAKITKETSGDATGLREIYIKGTDDNANLFCISKGYDQALGYSKDGSARAEVTEIFPDGNAKSVKFDAFRDGDTILSDVQCVISRTR